MRTDAPSLEGIKKVIPAGRTLYQAGEEATQAFYVHHGTIKVLADSWVGLHRGDNEQRTDRLLDVAGPRDFLGIHHGKHPHTTVTASDALVTIIPHEHLKRPENTGAILDYLARSSVRNEARLQQNDLPVAIRLLETLKDLARRFGDASQPDVSFTLPLTHTDLADLVNSSRVTITKFLAELQREGIVEGGKGEYTLHVAAAEPYIANLIFSS